MSTLIPAPAALAAVAGWAVAALIWDARERRLPNLLTVGGLGLAVVHLLATGHSLLGAPASQVLLCGLVAAAGFGALWARGQVGAGDLKWMTAVALATTPAVWIGCWIVGSGLAGLFAVAALAGARLGGSAGSGGGALSRWISGRAKRWRSAGIPLGVPYGVGLLCALAALPAAPVSP